ncbi:hypothetical protein ABRY94_11890 [Castellaniella ginsengisoli]|uniref:Uncharacterized protein n=1 Tax=Castellaniella ginsengisoli TaxID=546114 RepID=A0AB39ENI7_9BURK
MANEIDNAKIYPADSTRALLGLAFAMISEISHHHGYDKERFAKSLKAIASTLEPDTPGTKRLFSTFLAMIENGVEFESKDDSKG